MASAIFQSLLDEGRQLRTVIIGYLDDWPRDESGVALRWAEVSGEHRAKGIELVTKTRQWFNSASLLAGPLILHDKTFLYQTLRQVEAAIR
jgi:hypothetical protein